jgi:hypothetical protein
MGAYTIQAAAPVFTPGAGNYTSAQAVAISTATPGASIRYTTDGSIPSETLGTIYSGSVQISQSAFLQAIAYSPGLTDSPVITGAFTLQANAPVFGLAAGTYTGAQSVAISTTTTGALIRYTTDGSTPTETNGTIYSGAVTISTTTTLKAIAYEGGFSDSSVTNGTYTIIIPAAAPVFSPAVGHAVAITSATSGASIRYTTDGSLPTETHGTLYSVPVGINAPATLQAIAYATGYSDSPVTSATIGTPTITIITPVSGSTIN